MGEPPSFDVAGGVLTSQMMPLGQLSLIVAKCDVRLKRRTYKLVFYCRFAFRRTLGLDDIDYSPLHTPEQTIILRYINPFALARVRR